MSAESAAAASLANDVVDEADILEVESGAYWGAPSSPYTATPSQEPGSLAFFRKVLSFLLFSLVCWGLGWSQTPPELFAIILSVVDDL